MPMLAFNAVYLNGCIQVIDLSMLHPGAVPVEEDPGQVVEELKKMGYEIGRRPIVYLDIYDRWDVMLVENDKFHEYLEIGCPTWELAVSKLLKHKRLEMPKHGDDLWDKPTQPWTGINPASERIIIAPSLKH